MTKKRILCAFVLAVLCLHTSAQSVADTLFFSKSKNNTISFFDKQYDSQLAINKGTIFRQINQDVYYGTTIFGNNLIYKGNVVFQGQSYNNVDLAYDIKSDNLIHVKVTNEWIVLLKSAITSFNLADKFFVNITSFDENTNGFYELLLAGKTEVLAKHKIVANRFYPGTFKKQLEVKTTYFIQKKSKLYPVKSKNDLIIALSDKKKEVLNLMKEQSLSLNKNEEYVIKAVVKFYDELN